MVSRRPRLGFERRLAGQGDPVESSSRRPVQKIIMKSMMMSRRALLGGATAALAGASLARPAKAAAEFQFKLGVNTPDTHPLTVRLSEAAKDIAARSSGASS
jgi:hypothetical protein